MTQTWPHKFEGRERTKNKPITINARTLSSANLSEMTLRPRDRPSTVPANMPSNQNRRFLDNIDQYMGKAPSDQPGSTPSTPGRGRANSNADRRSPSSPALGVARRRQPVTDTKGKFKDNNYFFGSGMGRAEPLAMSPANDKARASYGLTPFSQMKAHMNAGGQMRKMASPGFQVNGMNFTTSQEYGCRAGEGEAPVYVQPDRGVNVIMGM